MSTVVTIDGPAGAGKSTASRALSRRLGFEFLDTGAMYRAITLAGLRGNVNWSDDADVRRMLEGLTLDLRGEEVWLNDENVSREIRTTQVTTQVHYAAENSRIREHLVQLQRQVAENRRIVTEGRDQGTVVFPEAICKIFLTAPAKERAQRRYDEMIRRGETELTFEEILSQQQERDRRDTKRDVGRLVAANDAIPVRTDGLTQDQVVDRLEQLVRDRIEKQTAGAGQ